MLPRGRIAKQLVVTEVRELTKDDLVTLAEPRHKIDRVKSFRSSHHALARYLATGMEHQVAAEAAGYSSSRVASLMSDPAFRNLVETYRDRISADFLEKADEFAKLAVGNMIRAERMLADKLETMDEEGETPPTRELVAISADRMDRFGYGKHSTQEHKHDFASELENMIRRSNGAKDVTPVVSSPPTMPRVVTAASPSPPSAPFTRRRVA